MNRSEIGLLNLEPTVGDEIRKTRPVIIVSDNTIGFLSLKVIGPITDWKDRYDEVIWMTKLTPNQENGLSKISGADSFQVRSVSKNRFIKRLGKVSSQKMTEIETALAIVLQLKS